jgi:uncharacterized Zn-finger protein
MLPCNFQRCARNSVNPFKCTVCTARFDGNVALLRHMSSHNNERPYPCSQCPKRFTQPGNRDRHISTHKDEKPFVCTLCKKGFKDRSNFKRHCKRQHQTAVAPPSPLMSDAEEAAVGAAVAELVGKRTRVESDNDEENEFSG